MAENKQQLTPEQTANLVNQLIAENKTLRSVLSDTGEKIARLEIVNSEIKVKNIALQEALANATSVPHSHDENPVAKVEEE